MWVHVLVCVHGCMDACVSTSDFKEHYFSLSKEAFDGERSGCKTSMSYQDFLRKFQYQPMYLGHCNFMQSSLVKMVKHNEDRPFHEIL